MERTQADDSGPERARAGRPASALTSAWLMLLATGLGACSGGAGSEGLDAGARDASVRDAGPAPRDAGRRTYSCTTPDWSDADWIANSGCFYVVDVRDAFFNQWCWLSGACAPGSLPPDSSIELELERHDELAALVSLQGLVNRTRPTLYLVAEDHPDSDWLTRLPAEGIWLQDHRRSDLTSLRSVLEVFGDHPALRGSVRWTADEPFTMNVAFALAGADDLVVVRAGSALEAELTRVFPLREDLVGRFESKRAANEWLIDTYLATGRLAPELALISDGWQVHEWTRGRFNTQQALLMQRDAMVSRRQLGIAYGVHPNAPDPTQPTPPPPGEGRAVLQRAMDAVRARVGPGRVFSAAGWPPDEYLFDCDGNGRVDQADGVRCGEWAWAELLSANGGTIRVGSGAYAKEAANTSFFAHGPGTDLLVQPAPLTPPELLRAGHALGPPSDHSFEVEGGTSWVLGTTSRAIYNDPARARHGARFLECNVSPAETGRGISQPLFLVLERGQHYRFVIHARRASGTTLRGRQRVTIDDGRSVLCEQPFTLDGPDWVPLTCDFEARRDGLAGPRLEVLLDTPDANYDFDEAYLLGATTMQVNLFRRYVLFYMGDYDLENMLAIIPVGVYPTAWDLRNDPEVTIPTAWGMTSLLNVWAPPLFAYFARTHTTRQTFVMPDSGAGYLNPTFLPAAYDADWIAQTTALQRPLGYRSGWLLDGTGGRNVLGADARGARIRAMYRVMAPDGIYYADTVEGPRELLDGLPLVPLDGPPVGGGTPPADATRALADALRRSPSPFSAYRIVYYNERDLSVAVRGLEAAGTPATALDPGTFLALYRQSKGVGTAYRMSVVGHDIPGTLVAGSTREVTVRVRNDGWDAWLSTPPAPALDCDGSGTAGAGCTRLAYGFSAGAVTATGPGAAPTVAYQRALMSRAVYPGEEIDVRLTLTAPTALGTHVLQLDGVKELYTFFESAGNVPWQKRIEVVAGAR
jgi:hypothetical protein